VTARRQNAAVSPLLSVEEALALVLERAPGPVQDEVDGEIERSLGAVLFRDVRADADYPAWPRSRVDGYAIRAAGAPGTFDVVVEVPAGKAPGDRIEDGQAARVFTGAAVPDGADAVVMQERVRANGRRVEIASAPEVGENITPSGSECRAGEIIATRGTVVTPRAAAALASVGYATFPQAARPRVVIVPTGNELMHAGERRVAPGRIRNSNGPALASAVYDYGARFRTPMPEPVSDERPALDDAVKKALADDPAIVLLTGGVSVGDYDFVPAVFADAGVERVFHGVNVQPGKPLWFGVRGKTLVFGLPGNPVSALVNATLFVRPAIRKMLGRADVVPESLVATLGGDVGAGTSRRRFVPARTSHDAQGRLVAKPVAFAGSGDVFGFSKADALIVVPENSPRRAAGERAQLVPLAGDAR